MQSYQAATRTQQHAKIYNTIKKERQQNHIMNLYLFLIVSLMLSFMMVYNLFDKMTSSYLWYMICGSYATIFLMIIVHTIIYINNINHNDNLAQGVFNVLYNQTYHSEEVSKNQFNKLIVEVLLEHAKHLGSHKMSIKQNADDIADQKNQHQLLHSIVKKNATDNDDRFRTIYGSAQSLQMQQNNLQSQQNNLEATNNQLSHYIDDIREKMLQLQNNNQTINISIRSHAESLEDLKTIMNDISKRSHDNAGSIAHNATKLSAHDAAINNHTSNVSELYNRISNNKTDIESNKVKINNNTSNIDTNSAQIAENYKHINTNLAHIDKSKQDIYTNATNTSKNITRLNILEQRTLDILNSMNSSNAGA